MCFYLFKITEFSRFQLINKYIKAKINHLKNFSKTRSMSKNLLVWSSSCIQGVYSFSIFQEGNRFLFLFFSFLLLTGAICVPCRPGKKEMEFRATRDTQTKGKRVFKDRQKTTTTKRRITLLGPVFKDEVFKPLDKK